MNNIIIELNQEDRARLDKLIGILEGMTTGPVAIQEATAAAPAAQDEPKAVEVVQEPTTEEKPAEEPQEAKNEAAAPAPDRRTVKSVAVKKIQAGHRDEVKALIQAYGSEKIDLVPEDKLAAFLEELTKIGG